MPNIDGALVPGDLRCEYMVNPLGIDETRPRLSWRNTLPESAGRTATASGQIEGSGSPSFAGAMVGIPPNTKFDARNQ